MNVYTAEGRKEIHNNLSLENKDVMIDMMKHPITNRSIEYNDNRVSLFSGQNGKRAVMGRRFENRSDVHCHHKTPVSRDGNDKYENLILVIPEVHKLIHATKPETIKQYLDMLKLTQKQKEKVNKLRPMAGCEPA